MISTVFAGGSFPAAQKNVPAIIGKDTAQMYAISLGLLVIVMLSVPVMLCTKPCLTFCPSEEHGNRKAVYEEVQEIQGYMYDPRNNEESEANAALAKRQGQMRSLQ